MAVSAGTKLDARTLRADFPIFEQEIHGKPLAFLDSAASSQKPRQVLDAQGELDLSTLDEVSRGGSVKVVATNLISNSLGTINPVAKLVEWAHAQGAIYVCDAAQGAPHTKVDVQALGVDFLAISGHK